MINKALLKKDLKLLGRDPMTILLALLPFLLEGLVQLILRLNPFQYLPFQPDLKQLEQLLRGMLPFFGGMMGGWMAGFLILEEREDDMIPLLRMSPLKNGELLTTRLFLAAGLGLTANLLLYAADRLLFGPDRGILLIFCLSALTGPFCLLVMVRFGKNRVQGLTLAKLSSLILLPPVVMLLTGKTPFGVFGILSPLSWLMDGFRSALGGDFSLPGPLAGTLYLGVLSLPLMRKRE